MKKTIALVTVLVLILSLATTTAAFAATEDTTTTTTTTKQRPELTDAQKAEMEAKKAQMEKAQEKWSKLTAAQKEEIYALTDKQADLQSQIIDKYLEFGLIDEATAKEMKAKITEGKTQMRTDGKMPMFGRGFKGGKGALKPATATSAS